MIWPMGAPCSKLYVNGKYMLKGAPPACYMMAMSEVFDTVDGYELWIQKLAAWQPSVVVQLFGFKTVAVKSSKFKMVGVKLKRLGAMWLLWVWCWVGMTR